MTACYYKHSYIVLTIMLTACVLALALLTRESYDSLGPSVDRAWGGACPMRGPRDPPARILLISMATGQILWRELWRGLRHVKRCQLHVLRGGLPYGGERSGYSVNMNEYQEGAMQRFAASF